jgi:hypothetical protein
MGIKYFNDISELPEKVRNKLSEQAQQVFLEAYNRYITMYIEDVAFEYAWQEATENDLFDILKAKEDSVVITKSNEDQQLVFGWASISINKDGSLPLDWDDDVIPPTELEKAAYNFVLKYRGTGEMHKSETVGQLVESVIFTKDKIEAMGLPEGSVPIGWWVGFHIPDKDVFNKIKDGTYKMFSIQGKSTRVKL